MLIRREERKMEQRLATLLLALSFLGVVASQNIMPSMSPCTQKDCKAKCQSRPFCMQTCPIPDCKMYFNCVGHCSLRCPNGGCSEMSCINKEKSGTCNVDCEKGNCTNMKATASLQNTLSCPGGSCDMECSNYASTCLAICTAGNCNLKCKAKSCSMMCEGGKCHVTAGLATKKIEVQGTDSKVTCAKGRQCGDEKCNADNNCISYMQNPLNETIKQGKFDVKVIFRKQKPVGAAESVHASVLMMVTTAICIVISH